MQVTCRCGQSFTLDVTQFPRQVRCHVCGHRFSVLDSGEVIDLREVPTPASAPLTTAIETRTEPRPPVDLLTSVCTVDVGLRAPASASDISTAEKCDQELALADLLWNQERQAFVLARLFGVEVQATRVFAFGVAVVALAFWLATFLVLVELVKLPQPIVLVFVVVFAVGSMVPPIVLFQWALKHEKAADAWRQKRIAVIRKYAPYPH
jgi:hypothetical protein